MCVRDTSSLIFSNLSVLSNTGTRTASASGSLRASLSVPCYFKFYYYSVVVVVVPLTVLQQNGRSNRDSTVLPVRDSAQDLAVSNARRAGPLNLNLVRLSKPDSELPLALSRVHWQSHWHWHSGCQWYCQQCDSAWLGCQPAVSASGTSNTHRQWHCLQSSTQTSGNLKPDSEILLYRTSLVQ